MSSYAHPFDAVASGYDSAFTARPLGRWLRAAVWERLGATFKAGERVLELGCGTGEDAVWLARRGVRVVATDAAPAMLEVALRKADAAGIRDQLSFARLDFAVPGALEDDELGVFDGVYSSFGPLNCLADRRPLAAALARRVRPGGRLVLVLMGPLCPWEVAWHLLHGEPRTAGRRFRAGAAAHVGDGTTIRVWYPSWCRLAQELAPFFRHRRTAGIGVLLPPSQLAHLVERWPHLFGALAKLEGRIAERGPALWLNDHYLAVFERS